MGEEVDQERLLPDDNSADDQPATTSTQSVVPSKDSGGRVDEHELEERAAVSLGDVLVAPKPAPEHRDELVKETLIPVSGMVRLSTRELEVIDHPAFQRLFEIYQLGQVYWRDPLGSVRPV